MGKKLTEKLVRRAIRDWLFKNGWGWHYKEKETHEKGVDIQTQNDISHSRKFLIEIKGESSSKSARSVSEVSFVYILGQIITRMKVIAPHAYCYGIGLPESSAKIAIRRIPWQVAKRLLLYIFSVDHSRKVKQYSWQELKKLQEK